MGVYASEKRKKAKLNNYFIKIPERTTPPSGKFKMYHTKNKFPISRPVYFQRFR